jgi:hypothetical protein
LLSSLSARSWNSSSSDLLLASPPLGPLPLPEVPAASPSPPLLSAAVTKQHRPHAFCFSRSSTVVDASERQVDVGKGWTRTGFGVFLAPATSALCPGALWPDKEPPPVGAAMTGRSSTPLARRDPPSRPSSWRPPPAFAESASRVPPRELSLLLGVGGEPSISQPVKAHCLGIPASYNNLC